MSKKVVIVSAVRTPIGRYGGSLKDMRADDLGSLPLKALIDRNPNVDWAQLDDIIYGCANQAGEDNRNVARMSSLLAGLPITTPGTTINRLCGSGMDAIGQAARAIKAGEVSLIIAGGVEAMTRAPFVMAKATAAFSRSNQFFDTTMGWRFINNAMKEAGKERAKRKEILLGITKAVLSGDGFLAAASFQETARVLIKAASEGRIDHLRGLKENVIIGRLVPIGAAMRGEIVVPEEEPREEKEA